ncbi:MAG: mycothiol system anti-sigma-R factor [Actinomycetota bacterium]|nr:mycothiol system anti-sigma-R factor [Actinomycetota bacterium]
MSEHYVDCEKLLNNLYGLIDGELQGSDRIELELHIQDCGDCWQRVTVERRFKEVIRNKCLDQAPQALIDSIKAALQTESSDPV